MRYVVILLVLILVNCASAQNAFVQFVHNSADPTLATADIWVDEQVVEDINFRFASGIIEVTPGKEYRIGIAPGNSTSSSECLRTEQMWFEAGKEYLVFATGLLSTIGFSPNPNGIPIDFTFSKVADISRQADNGKVSTYLIHQSTDAPSVDVTAESTVLAHDLVYGEISNRIEAEARPYTIALAPTGGEPLAAYSADLTAYSGGSAIIVTSGFLVPIVNQNGQPFGMYIIPPQGGPFIPLQITALPTASDVQFIHNSADPSLERVDLYVGPALVQRNFGFRTATPYVQVPSKTAVSIGIARQGSSSSSDVIFSETLNLTKGRYAVVLNGVADTTAFAPNPDANQSTSLHLLTLSGIRPSAISPTAFDAYYVNGCTDCMPVTVYHGSTKVLNNLVYNTPSSEYTSLEAGSEQVKLTTTDDIPLLSVQADISAIAGESGIILMSGFLAPSANNNGVPMGLWVALPKGGPLRELSTISDVQETDAVPLTLFPNPATTSVTIVGSDIITATVFNQLGVAVQTLNSPQQMMVKVDHLVPGTYTVVARMVGGREQTARFVKLR